MRCAGDPNIFEKVRLLKPAFLDCSYHSFSATFLGATIKIGKILKSFIFNSLIAAKVENVLPIPHLTKILHRGVFIIKFFIFN